MTQESQKNKKSGERTTSSRGSESKRERKRDNKIEREWTPIGNDAVLGNEIE